jgi:tetratricopeptide (TPR) repeat protein
MTLPKGCPTPFSSQYWLDEGHKKMVTGEYKSAIDDYRKVIYIDKSNDKAWYNLAAASFELENYEESLEYALKAVSLNEHDSENLVQAAVSFFVTGVTKGKHKYYDEALKYFNKYSKSEHEPDPLDSTIFAIFSSIAGKHIPQDTLEDLRSRKFDLPEGEDGFVESLALETIKEYENAINILRIPSEEDFHTVIMLFYRATLYDARKQYEAALDDCEKALELVNRVESDYSADSNLSFNPGDIYADLYKLKGDILRELGKYGDSLKFYEQALEKNPNFSDVWHLKGRILSVLGDSENATKCYYKAIDHYLNDLKEQPESLDILNNIGIMYYILEQFHNALKYFDKALDLDPKNADAWSNKGCVIYKFGIYEEAAQCFDRALILNPENLQALLNKCMYALKSGNYSEILSYLDQPLRKSERDSIVNRENKIYDEDFLNKAYLLRGISFYELEWMYEALDDLTKVSDNLFHGVKHHYLALCNYQLGRYSIAEQEYLQVVNDTSVQFVRHNLAVSYLKEGKTELAQRTLKADQQTRESKKMLKEIEQKAAEQTDWYDWWFRTRGMFKKTLGVFIISIVVLFFGAVIVSLLYNDEFIFGDFNSTASNTSSFDLTDPTTISPYTTNFIGFVIMIVILIIILLLPSLKKVKVGQIEVEAEPIVRKDMQFEPIISHPSMILGIISPQSPFLRIFIKLFQQASTKQEEIQS